MSKIQITIEANSPAEFKTILAELLGGVSITKIDVKSDNPDKVVEKIAEKAHTNGVAKPAEKKATAAPAKKPEPAADDAPVQGKGEDAAAEAKPEPKPAEKKATTKAKPEPAAEGNAPELPDNIKNTNSMRDLLTYLSEHGVDSVDAMVAACVVLKKDVPILSKVPNVEERVRRALDVLALFAAPDAAQA